MEIDYLDKNREKSKVPNIIFILADDMGAWAMHNAGNQDVITPNLDRLAREGAKFNNFYCASPVCSPARASIMTGMMPSAHGVYDWIRSGSLDKNKLGDIASHYYFQDENKPIQYLAEYETYTDVLSRNNYDCRLSGKWHLGDSLSKQAGFTSWYTIGRGGCEYMNPDMVRDGKIFLEDKYITDLIADDAIRNLNELAENYLENSKPFYLSVHFTAPHTPWAKDQHPEEIWKLYENCEFTSTPALPLHKWQIQTCEHVSEPGEAFRDIVKRAEKGEKVDNDALSEALKLLEKTEKERRNLLRGYYTAITAMDKRIGDILDRLDELNLSDNTLVIFMADNGMNLGQHGIWGKGNGTFPLNLYESSCKVPCLMRLANIIEAGQEINNICSQLDIFPSILDLCKCEANEVNKFRAGMSLLPLFNNKNDDADNNSKLSRPAVVVDEYGPNRMIRFENWKLVKRYPYGPDELYNLDLDPDEEKNLIHEKIYQEKRFELENILRDWCSKYMDPKMDGSKEAVTGTGQMCLGGKHNRSTLTFYQQDQVDANLKI